MGSQGSLGWDTLGWDTMGGRWDLGTDGTLGPMGPGPQGPWASRTPSGIFEYGGLFNAPVKRKFRIPVPARNTGGQLWPKYWPT